MPKVVTEQARREKSLLGAVARGRAVAGLVTDKDMAEAIGVNPATFSRYRRNYFACMSFETFCRMARRLNMSAREVCAAVGIPYKEAEE